MAAPTNLLLAQNFGAAGPDVTSLSRAAVQGLGGVGAPQAPPNGLQFQTREEAQRFLQASRAPLANGANGGVTLSRDAVAALQHAAQVAAGQGKLEAQPPNGGLRPQLAAVVPNLGQGQNQALANLHTQAQLQVAMNAQRAAHAAAATSDNSAREAAALDCASKL